jgi:uncharacterized protein
VNQRSAWIAGFAAAVLVWVAAPELAWPARMLTALLLGPAPVGFLLQARLAETLPQPFPRLPIYAGSLIVLWTLGGVSFVVALASGFSLRDIGLVPIQLAPFALWTAAMMAAGAAIVTAFRAAGLQESPIMHDLIPHTSSEKCVFAGLSVSAGICEEVAFRGFLLAALSIAIGSSITALALSSIIFGVMHSHQNAGGAARASVLGAVLAIPLLATGSLLPSIAAHALIDLAGGLWLHRWLIRS